MIQIAILKETRDHETRVAMAPDIVEKLVKAGHKIIIEKGAGDLASFQDGDFKNKGAVIASSPTQTIKDADIILKIGAPQDNEVKLFKKGQTLICHANAMMNTKIMTDLNKIGVRLFALELLPRITRAQSMDILSSQANMAGYKAVLDALEHYDRALPMMSTAAGRVNPANVFIMGVGVAGLQAIATAKRLGAVVYATDVRPATKEQVQSLGGKFVAVEDEEFEAAQTAGGYAKEMSAAYQKKQAALIDETIKKMDIVITTALIPGRKAPILLSEEQVKTMKAGSVIVDLAVEAGGNCPLSDYGKIVKKHGVTLVGHANVPARLASTTSQLFARNLYNFMTPMFDKETGDFKPDNEDEIIKATMVMADGKILNERLQEVIGASPATSPATPKPSSKSSPASAKKKAVSKPKATDDKQAK